MFDAIEKYHQILLNENVNAAPDKSLFFSHFYKKLLGHIIEGNRITPLKSHIAAIIKLEPPSHKKNPRMLNFLSKYDYKMQLYLR